MSETNKQTETSAEEYREKFWEDLYKYGTPSEERKYKGLFKFSDLQNWTKTIEDKDVAFRLGFTLGFSEIAVNSFIGLFHIDYKKEKLHQDAIYKFIINYLHLNKRVTDFRFYRKLREVLKLSSLPIGYNAIKDKETAKKDKKLRISNYEDIFLKWRESVLNDDLQKECVKLFKEIYDSKLEGKEYDILCVKDIKEYFDNIEKNKKFKKDDKEFLDFEKDFYVDKIETEAKPHNPYVDPDSEEEDDFEKPDLNSMPKLPNEPPQDFDCVLLKTIKIYSTIKGYLMDKNVKHDLLVKYEDRIKNNIFNDEIFSCFFLVDRKLETEAKCIIQDGIPNIITNQHIIDLIVAVDKKRATRGDIFHDVRNNDISIIDIHPNCPWHRLFKTLCKWRNIWSLEKFGLIIRRFLLKKNFEKLAYDFSNIIEKRITKTDEEISLSLQSVQSPTSGVIK